MKIQCTQLEFAQLITACTTIKNCDAGCPLKKFCPRTPSRSQTNGGMPITEALCSMCEITNE